MGDEVKRGAMITAAGNTTFQPQQGRSAGPVAGRSPRRVPTLVRPLAHADLDRAAALFGDARARMHARLRWYLHTPFAVIKGLYAGDALLGLGCGLQFGASAYLAHLVVDPSLEGTDERATLTATLLSEFARNGACSVTMQVDGTEVGVWERQGFRPEQEFVRYQHGSCAHPAHEEVGLLQPSQVLALFHLDERATGETRKQLLLEHRFAAHAYVEKGLVRGGLLPLLGQGLILAHHAEAGLELQRWLMPHQRGIIVPVRNAAACAHLEAAGHFAATAGVRMVLGRQLNFRPELVYAWPWDVA